MYRIAGYLIVIYMDSFSTMRVYSCLFFSALIQGYINKNPFKTNVTLYIYKNANKKKNRSQSYKTCCLTIIIVLIIAISE